jgi:rifampicin phosphotransferase
MTTLAPTDANEAAEPIAFTAPGPGGWQRLADHFPGALTAEYQLLYAETAPPAMAAMFERYGVLAAGMDVAYVNGHLYIAPVPLAGPREMKRTPPAALVWLLARVHPAFRKRTAAARRTLDTRPWRAAARRWFETERSEWQRRNASVQSLDPASMTPLELCDHLVECRQHVIDGYRRHFELHGDDLIPVGLLIVRCEELGIEPAVALSALAASTGPDPAPADTPSWQLVTGYDLDAQAWIELNHHHSPAATNPAEPVDLPSLVPEPQRGEVRTLVDDARTASRLRDDNGLLTGAWPMGLLRRAMLEAGHRLALPDAGLAIEMTVTELVTALTDTARLDPAAVIERRDLRMRASALDAPSTLGPKFPIPTLSALPRPLALIGAAQLAAADHMTGTADGPIGIGSTSYTGRALVVDDPLTAFDLLEPGDIVVTNFTSPSWNAVLAVAGALVTSTGGLACHAAFIARELGLPAVIGDTTAFERFETGDLIVVDPAVATVGHAAEWVQQPDRDDHR